jgi:hypothetical protein
MSHLYNKTIQFSPESVDAFSRLRVSLPFTLGDYKHLYGIDPNFRDVTSNGGTVTFQQNQSCARLATTSATNSSSIHQTKMYHHYMPGKSQLIKTTFNLYANVDNVVKRTGYFDSNNGIYFEQSSNGALSFCIRTDTSGTADDSRRVYQQDWNINTCNTSITGNDSTAINYGDGGTWDLDITKTQIMFIDFQWLGVGKVRCGFVHDGDFVIAHEFYNSNKLPIVYMRNPNLPIRCEIFNTGTTTGGYMDQICASVASEGGYLETGQDWAQTSNSRSIAAGASLPVMALRLKNTFGGYQNRITVRLTSTDVFSTADNVKYSVRKLPNSSMIDVNGTSWKSVNGNSAVEYIDTAISSTDGEEISNGFVAASAQNSQKPVATSSSAETGPTAKKNFITQNYDSTNSEIYVLEVTNIGTVSTVVSVGMQWREIY